MRRLLPPLAAFAAAMLLLMWWYAGKVLIPAAGGLMPLDMRLLGFSAEAAQAYVAALEGRGRAVYLLEMRWLDTGFMWSFALLMALGLLRLLCSTFPSARGLVYKSRCMKGVANLSAVSDLQIHVTKHGRTSSRRDRELTPEGAEAAPPAASPLPRSRWTALLAVTALICVEYALRARRR